MSTSVEFQRSVGGCFHLFIPTDEADMRQAIRDSMLVEKAVKLMLSGRISPDELLEMVEPAIHLMDDYVDEVEQNLAHIYLAD